MFKILVLNIILLAVGLTFGQNEIVPLNNVMGYRIESNLYQKIDTNFHSGVRPFIKSEVIPFLDSQHVVDFGFSIGNKPVSKLKITPLIQANFLNQTGEDMRYGYAGGLYLEGNLGNRIGYSGFYNYVTQPRFNYLDSSIFMRDAVNGSGYDIGNNTAHHAEFYFNIVPNKYFAFTLGNGKHFWGDGYRSVMLSDNAAPYPFLRIMSTFWNVKYTNLFAMHTDTNYGKIQRKYAASHQLSWNIIPNLNLTIFESVIFIGNDTLSQRGFDVNYLNPVIFYRPIEYAQGSSDNVLFGASSKYVLQDKYVFYGQLVLDEFLLSEYRNNQGWWANKFAAQIGFKTYDLVNIKNLSFQTEVNFIRPFTFSHVTSLLNYGHQGQSLAHPMGSNFHESVTRVRYQKDKWYFEAKVIYIDRGEDFDSVSYGGDIYRSYTARDSEYDHSIGQGQSHYIWYNELKIAYNISSKMNLRAFASYAFRSDKSSKGTENLNLIQVGITSALWNTYSDF